MKKLKLVLAAGLIGAGVISANVPEPRAEAAAHTSYVANNFRGYYDQLPEIKAAWSSDMDIQDDDYAVTRGSAAAGGGKIFIIKNGQLLALNAQTGKTAWKYGAKMTLPLLYQDGIIYGSTQNGTIVAVNAATGKGKWSAPTAAKGAIQLLIDKDQLLAVNGDIQAFNLKDGKLKWKDNYSERFYEPVLAAENLVLAVDSVSGAYTYNILHAFDRSTGKELWQADNHRLPIDAGGGTLLAQRSGNLMDLVPLTTLDTLDAKTGKSMKTTEYNPAGIDPEGALRSGGIAWIDGNNLYINEGNKVYGYPKNSDPAATKATYYSAAGSGQSLMYAAGPYDGRVLFSDGTSIYGIKTANQSLVSYYGGGDIARFELLGHGMYIARADGSVVAINLLTGKTELRLKTTGRGYGPTLLESGMIIVQSKGKVYAFKEPASLHQK
ncbi:PQQ-binding-like beta-propeller repeat protein [Paenibacillus sp. NFR01]|uniref:outer membrane protein assembly factor BamB family protein n=1 Tax=Paenibacillus sp. NFR01 TaxID=1566279 RepID=UPI0008BF58A0|nr:PQQ-binding-like beta-propeller repeat protein [Paenibacillus sp. NFR01]SEU25781.1 outer membrane protein assembly factor BamB [Paenibacillus sp. NFR01]